MDTENTLPAKPKARSRLRGPMVKYSDAVADVICGRMADGETLRQICRDPAMPARATVYRWLKQNSGFRDQYAQARELLVEHWADEIIEIADDGTTDYVTRTGRNGTEYLAVDQEHIQRSRLRVDTRRWLLSKLNPAQYGDHMEVHHAGDVQHHHDIGDVETVRRLALFLLQGNGGGNVIQGHADTVPDQPDPAGSDGPVDKD